MSLLRVGAAAALVTLACNSTLPHPSYTAHTTSELVEVPFPPPPARVETVPDSPSSGAVWIDGEWSWRGRRWSWKSGYWAPSPGDTTYSPWTMTRDLDGTVFFAPGTWRNAKGEPIDPPAPLAVGVARSQNIVDPEGEMELTGRNLSPDGGRLGRRDSGG
jgi:hypothetical protein